MFPFSSSSYGTTTLLSKGLQHERTTHTFTAKLSIEIMLCSNPLITFTESPEQSHFLSRYWNLSDLVGVWLKLEEQHVMQELQELQELVKRMKLFVLKLAYPVDSEVDGSERRTDARMSEHQMQHESPFWHSLLLLIPC